ncbi:MAG: DEAD/DEAH box helicase, partial [Acidobacteria bacterium]|nr:DEAD/DEAH box helicase [Acidobacteriota bacterium]
MFIVHGGYLAAFARGSDTDGTPGFFLWGEADAAHEVPRDEHPRDVPVDQLEEALRAAGAAFPGSQRGALTRTRITLSFPVWHGRPVPSDPALRDVSDYSQAGAPHLSPLEVDALLVAPDAILDALVPLPEALAQGRLTAGDDLLYWCEAARWVFDLLHRRRVAPAFEEAHPRWRLVLSDSHEKDRLARFVSALPPLARTASLEKGGHGTRHDTAFPAAAAVLRAFLDDVTDAGARELLLSVLPEERRDLAGDEPELALVASLAMSAKEISQAGPPALSPDKLSRLREWSLPLLEPVEEGTLRLGIRLVPPERGDAPGAFRLRYHLEATEDPTLIILAEEVWSGGASVRRLGRRFAHPEEALLSRLGAVSPLSPPVARSLEERHPVGAELSLEEAHRFLTKEAPLLRDAGASVLLPGDGKITRVRVRLHGEGGNPSAVTRFGLATLVEFDWRVAVGDELLTPTQFEELAARKIPLVDLRGEWVLLDPESVSRTLALFDKRPSGRTTLGEFLKLAGGLETDPGGYPIEEVVSDGWLRELLDPVAAREEIGAVAAPPTLTGTLRPYQMRGMGWLRFLLSRGLGACLADDMGLGKTIQFLATLLLAREAGEPVGPSLLVCPTSVAENWVREAARFAPSLRVSVHHGPTRLAGEAFRKHLAETDLLVTTYALTHRDRVLLSDVVWEYVALDEAQNVKNRDAAQSRAVRALKAKRRAALTGTPVENRLSELKAIFDFLNPGLLGSDEDFRTHFSMPIERHRDREAEERLRRITGPFLLRRAKTDEGVAPDLPEKIETKELVGLSREQATLYRATTRALLEGIGQAQGKSRRAKVLLLLLRLKQICNHPALFLRDGSRLEGRSAKMDRLFELLEETLAEKRPALLFTQFAEMGHILVRALKERFASEVLFLHGRVPRGARDEMVRHFQEAETPPPFFVLSLKAGGSGLNLTRASHVFHVDRWWNPAVEDQATDRAFRIGQNRNVQVHKFVCKGTLEERIDAMIEDKKDLARSIVGAGEAWITNLSDTELVDLVALSPTAVD